MYGELGGHPGAQAGLRTGQILFLSVHCEAYSLNIFLVKGIVGGSAVGEEEKVCI